MKISSFGAVFSFAVASLSFLSNGLAPAQAAPNELSLPAVKAWTGDYDAMIQRRLIRILVPYSKTLYFVDRGKQMGVVADISQRLEDWINADIKSKVYRVNVAIVPTSRDKLMSTLLEGRGDIIAANWTITPERQAKVDFTTPWATNVSEVLVTGPEAPQLASVSDLAGRDIYVRTDSSYAVSLATLNETLAKAGAKPVKIIPADGALEDEDIMEMVQSGLLPYAVVDAYKGDIWAKILPKLTVRRDLALRADGSIAWAFRKDSPQLAARLNAFVSQHKIGTTFGNIIKRRYYSDDKMLKNAMAKTDRERFAQLVGSFKANGANTRFDWLMLAAQGYQESQLDQSRRSQRGAVGIMQLLPTTAKEVGVTGIEADAGKNITAGALYMRMLIDKYVNDPGLDERDRVLFAFAAYNAGPGNLRKFRKIAEASGLDPNLWFNNVEQGAAKTVGRETVQYVGNIYRYYIAYKLASELASKPAEGTP